MSINKFVPAGTTAGILSTKGKPPLVFGFGDGTHGKLAMGEPAASTASSPDEGPQFEISALGVLYKKPSRVKTLQKEHVYGIACGSHNSAFVTSSGNVLVVGAGTSSNDSSVLGDETSTQASTPRVLPRGIASTLPVRQVAFGNYHGALLTKLGHVFTWGWGQLGQLGHGDFNNVIEPKQVKLSCVKQVVTGTKFTLALTLFGEVYSWGSNDQGQLGIGNMEKKFTPCRVKKLQNVSYIAAGSSHALAVTEDSTVWIWGQVSVSGKVQSIPMEIEVLRNVGVRRVACGQFHNLALTHLGVVYEWKVGETPQPVLGAMQGHFVRSIACGSFHSLAVTHSGKLFSWGRNKSGQLGYDVEPSSTSTSAGTLSSPGRRESCMSLTASAAALLIPSDSTPRQVRIAPAKRKRAASVRRSLAPAGSVSTTPSEAPGSPARGESDQAPAQFYVSHIAAGEFHNMVAVERDPRRLLLWQLLKKEQQYVVKLRIITEMYLVAMTKVDEESAHSSTDGIPVSALGMDYSSPVASVIQRNKNRAATHVNSSLALQLAQLAGFGGLAADQVASGSGITGLSDGPNGGGAHVSLNVAGAASPGSVASSSGVSSSAGGASSAEATILSILTRHNASNTGSPRRKSVSSSSINLGLNAATTPPTSPSDGHGSQSKRRLTATGLKQMIADSSFQRMTAEVFSNILQIYELHLSLLSDLDRTIHEAMQGADPVSAVASLLYSYMHRFNIYLFYADQYSPAAYNLMVLVKSFPHVSALLKQQCDRANALHQRLDKPGYRELTLKALLIEPLKQIAVYSHILKKLRDVSKPVSEGLSQTVEYMSGLLERVCRNFNFVDPMEILTSTLDERGYPQIGGGTVQQLVQRLTHHQFIDQEFTAAFFLTYRLFTTPIEFLRLLVARFKIAPPPAAPSSSAALGMDNDPASFQTSVRKPVQQRVIQTILLWLTSPLTGQDWEIKDAPHALELAKFIDEDVMKEEEHKLHATAIQSILVKGRTVTTLRGGLKLGAGGPTPTPATAAPGSITSIADFDPSVVAATIAVEDASLFRDVQFKEFLHKSWSDPKFEEIAPGLFKMTQRFNQLGQWVAYEIVRPELPKERAHVIQAFVSIAQELLELRDYSGMLAIMGGLNNSSVSRLKKTAQKLSSKTTQQLEHLNESVSGKDNYRFLRQKWTDAEPPAVPFLAMALKDLTFIEDGNPDSLENGGINFYKWRKLSEVVHNIMQYRDIPYSVQPSDDVTNYLSKGIVEAKELAEDGIFKTSKKRE